MSVAHFEVEQLQMGFRGWVRLSEILYPANSTSFWQNLILMGLRIIPAFQTFLKSLYFSTNSILSGDQNGLVSSTHISFFEIRYNSSNGMIVTITG